MLTVIVAGRRRSRFGATLAFAPKPLRVSTGIGGIRLDRYAIHDIDQRIVVRDITYRHIQRLVDIP